VVMIVW